MKLPIKTRMLEIAIEKDAPFTALEMQEILKAEYGNGRITSLKEVEKQLEMYCRVSMMKAVSLELDENNKEKIVATYAVTAAGKEAEKFIPKKHD